MQVGSLRAYPTSAVNLRKLTCLRLESAAPAGECWSAAPLLLSLFASCGHTRIMKAYLLSPEGQSCAHAASLCAANSAPLCQFKQSEFTRPIPTGQTLGGRSITLTPKLSASSLSVGLSWRRIAQKRWLLFQELKQRGATREANNPAQDGCRRKCANCSRRSQRPLDEETSRSVNEHGALCAQTNVCTTGISWNRWVICAAQQVGRATCEPQAGGLRVGFATASSCLLPLQCSGRRLAALAHATCSWLCRPS